MNSIKQLHVVSLLFFASILALQCKMPVYQDEYIEDTLELPYIERQVPPLNIEMKKVNSLVPIKLKGDMGQIFYSAPALTQKDCSSLDLVGSLEQLLVTEFDSYTIWPDSSKLPSRFSPDLILENGKNPGLGLRALHRQGITGEGVSIAIIDWNLLTSHQEYASRLRYYKEISSSEYYAHMHGTAIASIAAGTSTGVAPKANLFFLACTMSGWDDSGNGGYCFYDAVKAVLWILNLNKHLPASERIRVISMSFGWSSSPEKEEIHRVVQMARNEGILVVSSSMRNEFGFAFSGLDRNPLGDPDSISSYKAGSASTTITGTHIPTGDVLFVPMDSRTVAEECSDSAYRFDHRGGFSWAIPWIAGMYALSVQVKPDVTSDLFWKIALETSNSLTYLSNNQTITINHVINPTGLIAALQKM